MKKAEGSFELTATDLVGYLNCRHLSELDRAVAEEKLAKPKVFDPLLEVLRERGFRHEQCYIEHLKHAGLDVVRIDGIDVGDSAVSETFAAMKKGAPVIAQGALAHQGWRGRADILRRVEIPSAIGEWSYEAIDTKLSRETKAGAVLQLCLYSDLLTQTQRVAPEHMHVVAPWSDFKPRTYRFADYAAYYREVKRGLRAALAEREIEETYPDPKTHCDICRWREECDKRRRADDHLCLVAGISKIQINELKQRGITTVKALAGMVLPLNWKPDRGSIDAYSRVCEQAASSRWCAAEADVALITRTDVTRRAPRWQNVIGLDVLTEGGLSSPHQGITNRNCATGGAISRRRRAERILHGYRRQQSRYSRARRLPHGQNCLVGVASVELRLDRRP